MVKSSGKSNTAAGATSVTKNISTKENIITKYEEQNIIEICWIIPIDKYVMDAALRKIGVPDEKIEKWCTDSYKNEFFEENDLENGKIYVFNNKGVGWLWESLDYDINSPEILFKGDTN